MSKKDVEKFVMDVLACSEVPIKDVEEIKDEQGTAKTPVEIISPDEIYLISENGEKKRLKRICGAVRSIVGNKDLRCLCPAGYRTVHFGQGRCYLHEALRMTSPLRRLKLYADQGFALSIADAIEKYPELLEDETLYEVKEEIVILRVMLSQLVNTLSVSAGDYSADTFTRMKQIIGIIESLLSAKATGSRIKSDKLAIDVKALKLFVASIFEVLKRELGGSKSALYQRVVLAIDSEVFFPAVPALQLLLEDKTDEKT